MTAPGELVHMDVLHLFALKGQKPAMQFTVVDAYTRMAHALIAPRRTTDAALQALAEAQQRFGFAIQRVLTDNDVTFAWIPRVGFTGPKDGKTQFTRALQAQGIRHSTTRIRRPQTNGKVERFHRTVQEELYRTHPLFTSEPQRRQALAHYLQYYNTNGYHTAIRETPVQRRDSFAKTTKVSTTP